MTPEQARAIIATLTNILNVLTSNLERQKETFNERLRRLELNDKKYKEPSFHPHDRTNVILNTTTTIFTVPRNLTLHRIEFISTASTLIGAHMQYPNGGRIIDIWGSIVPVFAAAQCTLGRLYKRSYGKIGIPSPRDSIFQIRSLATGVFDTQFHFSEGMDPENPA